MAAQMAEEERVEMQRYKAAGVNPDGFTDVAPTPNEKFGATASSRPLLDHAASGSPPGTPQGTPGQNPYSDGFSPIDNSGYGSPSMPPTSALPGPPNSQYGHIDGVTNPNGGHTGVEQFR